MLNTILKSLRAPLSFAVLIIAFTTQSCKKTDISEEEISPAHIEELRQFVANTNGVSGDKVVYSTATEAFIIDKDHFISFQDADDRFKKKSTTITNSISGIDQRRYDYIINSSKRGNITLYADATVSAEWVAVLDQAIANWNSTGSGIHMSRLGSLETTTTVPTTTTTTTPTTTTTGRGKKKTTVTTYTTNTTTSYTTTTSTVPVDVLVTAYYDGGTSTVAYAYMPDYYGNPGQSVNINTYYDILSSAQKIFALTHELGHTIGFNHTDGTYGTIVPGTPEVDPNSVMNSFVLPWAGFTYYDQVAVKTVYPL